MPLLLLLRKSSLLLLFISPLCSKEFLFIFSFFFSFLSFSLFFFWGGGGGGGKIYRDGKRRDRQTEIETVNGCFTPSQPVRLYQGERRTKKEREIRMCEKGGGGGNKT